MAKCDLKIELDEPDRIFRGGEFVAGKVSVRVDQDVKCNGLQLRSLWETHGKGNVAREVVEETTLFQGEWSAGTVAEYRFELECSNWPPTYHGTHLNIDHYVEAQVDIPWAFDPKSRHPFRLMPNPEGTLTVPDPEPSEVGVVGKAIGVIAVALFCLAALAFIWNPCIWVVAFCGAAWWFWASYLPNRKLGKVEFQILTSHVSAGESLQAKIVLQPKAVVPINRIRWTIHGKEVVVRGYGTDRSTHTHHIMEHVKTEAEGISLKANLPNEFILDFLIPEDAAASVDLDDNDIEYSVEAYVDIPRWPDWKKTEKFQVLPPGTQQDSNTRATQPEPVSADDSNAKEHVLGVSFQDTVELLAKIRTDWEQLNRVVSAVQGKEMQMRFDVKHPVSLGRIDPAVGYVDGRVFEGTTVDQQLSLLIYVPPERKAEFDNLSQQSWTGWGQISGYDDNIGSLQVRVST